VDASAGGDRQYLNIRRYRAVATHEHQHIEADIAVERSNEAPLKEVPVAL